MAKGSKSLSAHVAIVPVKRVIVARSLSDARRLLKEEGLSDPFSIEYLCGTVLLVEAYPSVG